MASIVLPRLLLHGHQAEKFNRIKKDGALQAGSFLVAQANTPERLEKNGVISKAGLQRERMCYVSGIDFLTGFR